MEQETQQVTENQDFQSYKTRQIAPDERDVLLLVLDESIKMGKKHEFHYSSMNDINHEALKRTSYLDKTILAKKKLFALLDERSYTYNRILNTAKLALRKLQDDGDYNYYSADLISKFVQLEEIFGDKKLRSIGVRFIEEQEAKIAEQEEYKPTHRGIILDEEDVEGEFIPQGLSGDKLKKYKSKMKEEQEARESLKSLDFIEDEEVKSEDIESLDFE